MTTKRQLIINALDAKLKNIKTDNGYFTNAGDNVYAWLDKPVQPSKLPAIIYKDSLASREDGPIGFFRWSLKVEIGVFAEDGANTASTVRKLIADIIKAVVAGDSEKWGGHAITTKIGDAETEIEKLDKTDGAALITIFIIYDAPIGEV